MLLATGETVRLGQGVAVKNMRNSAGDRETVTNSRNRAGGAREAVNSRSNSIGWAIKTYN